MNNMVSVRVYFEDVKRVNNHEVPVSCMGELWVALDRRFLYNLEDCVSTFKELGNVEIYFSENRVATLYKNSLKVGEKEVKFERFGGKIAKEFYADIDTAVSELE